MGTGRAAFIRARALELANRPVIVTQSGLLNSALQFRGSPYSGVHWHAPALWRASVCGGKLDAATRNAILVIYPSSAASLFTGADFWIEGSSKERVDTCQFDLLAFHQRHLSACLALVNA